MLLPAATVTIAGRLLVSASPVYIEKMRSSENEKTRCSEIFIIVSPNPRHTDPVV
jgi:hypothetical protein